MWGNPMFSGSYVSMVLFFQGPMFSASYVSRVLCFHGPRFSWSYVSRVLCSQGPILLLVIYFLIPYVPRPASSYSPVSLGHTYFHVHRYRSLYASISCSSQGPMFMGHYIPTSPYFQGPITVAGVALWTGCELVCLKMISF